MRTRFLALLALGACSGVGLHKAEPGDALVFEGRLDPRSVGLAAADVARLPRRSVRGLDPATGRPATFTGAALAPLVTEWLPLARGTDLVIFHGAAGRRAAVPINAVRQLQPVLADEVDGKPLAGAPKGQGPFLVAWPDAESPGLETDPRVRWWWVRGVKRVELAAWQQADGKALRVPAGASDEARRGSDAFATYCMTCHRLRGKGGEAGPELTTFLRAGDGDRLVALLPGHLAARAGVPVPDPPPGVARQIAAFLRAVAVAAAAGPDDEIQDAEPAPLPPPAGPRRP